MKKQLRDDLEMLYNTHKFQYRGALSLALHLTRLAIEEGLPLDVALLVTGEQGQVRGASGERVRKILLEYGETRRLAKEGGRTNRGNMSRMHHYVDFLNSYGERGISPEELKEIEQWWATRISQFLSRKPFKLNKTAGKTIEFVVTDILTQAANRERDYPGANLVGTVLQHLVGAKLEMVLNHSEPQITHHGSSAADDSTGRNSDFQIDRVAIHVSNAPSDALIEKCKDNIASGLRPLIVTRLSRVQPLLVRCKDLKVEGQVEVIPIEQFVAANVYEWSKFESSETGANLQRLIRMYNLIVAHVEDDPSLQIEEKVD